MIKVANSNRILSEARVNQTNTETLVKHRQVLELFSYTWLVYVPYIIFALAQFTRFISIPKRIFARYVLWFCSLWRGKERRLLKWIHCKIGFVNIMPFTSELFLFFNIDVFLEIFGRKLWETIQWFSIYFPLYCFFIEVKLPGFSFNFIF